MKTNCQDTPQALESSDSPDSNLQALNEIDQLSPYWIEMMPGSGKTHDAACLTWFNQIMSLENE